MERELIKKDKVRGKSCSYLLFGISNYYNIVRETLFTLFLLVWYNFDMLQWKGDDIVKMVVTFKKHVKLYPL